MNRELYSNGRNRNDRQSIEEKFHIGYTGSWWCGASNNDLCRNVIMILYWPDNRSENEGLRYLCEALKTNSTLAELDLYGKMMNIVEKAKNDIIGQPTISVKKD